MIDLNEDRNTQGYCLQKLNQNGGRTQKQQQKRIKQKNRIKQKTHTKNSLKETAIKKHNHKMQRFLCLTVLCQLPGIPIFPTLTESSTKLNYRHNP